MAPGRDPYSALFFFLALPPYPVLINSLASWGPCVDLGSSKFALLAARGVLFEDLLDFPVSRESARSVFFGRFVLVERVICTLSMYS